MKKLILAIGIIIIICGALPAQDGFNLYCYGSLDYYPTYIDNMIDMSINDNFFTNIIGIGLEYNYAILMIFIQVSAYTEMNRLPDMLSFSPTYAEYNLEISFWYGPIGFLYSRQYNHPIDTIDLSRRGEYGKFTINFDTRKIK